MLQHCREHDRRDTSYSNTGDGFQTLPWWASRLIKGEAPSADKTGEEDGYDGLKQGWETQYFSRSIWRRKAQSKYNHIFVQNQEFKASKIILIMYGPCPARKLYILI
jgi:hypothetical protein